MRFGSVIRCRVSVASTVYAAANRRATVRATLARGDFAGRGAASIQTYRQARMESTWPRILGSHSWVARTELVQKAMRAAAEKWAQDTYRSPWRNTRKHILSEAIRIAPLALALGAADRSEGNVWNTPYARAGVAYLASTSCNCSLRPPFASASRRTSIC